MLNTEEQNELLQLLTENNISAVIEGKRQGLMLNVYFKYNLSNISDFKGLCQRLINFKELGSEGL